jgi:S-adenosylmethionine/arginine decarboxylase-like enzyme
MERNIKLRKTRMFVLDLIDCQKEIDLPSKLKKDLISILEKNKIKVLKTIQKIFPPFNGATILFILSESHFAIHTWPEKKLVNLDLFLCNFRKNNERKVRSAIKELKDYFLPRSSKIKQIIRIN